MLVQFTRPVLLKSRVSCLSSSCGEEKGDTVPPFSHRPLRGPRHRSRGTCTSPYVQAPPAGVGRLSVRSVHCDSGFAACRRHEGRLSGHRM